MSGSQRMETPNDSKPSEKKSQSDGNWLAVCIAVGVALGVVTDNLGIFLALGVAVGVVGPFWRKGSDGK